MASQGIVLFYCLLAIVVSALALKFLRTTWVYFLVASLLPPMFLIGGDAVRQGQFSVWDDIVFVVLTLIAFGIAIGLFIIRFVWRKINSGATTPPGDLSERR
jgi:hypothetical protein